MFIDDAALGDGGLACVRGHVKIWRSAYSPNVGRGFKLDIHALWAVLKKPLAFGCAGAAVVAFVIARDKVD